MGTTADKLNKILNSKAAIKAAIEAKGVTDVGDVLADYPAKIASIQAGSGTDEYALESQMLILPVRSTTITTSESKTAAIATNDHIKIVDADLKHYTVKEWNDRSVANGFDNELIAPPVGFSLECNGIRTILYWPWQGEYYATSGTTSKASNGMQHSVYEYDQRTSAGEGTDYHGTVDENLGTHTAGSHFAADWSVTVTEDDKLELYSGNTKQRWIMEKNCGNVNAMTANNYAERLEAMYVQNEWLRHRFAICSGIASSETEGTITDVEILNSAGAQAQIGEDMFFFVNGQNTGLKAMYNTNNKYAVNNAYYFKLEYAEWLYEQQKTNGVNMNDTGVNSAERPLLSPGAKGAEAITVDGYWYIITPYISRPGNSSTNYDWNMADSHAVYYIKSLENKYMAGEKELYPYWTNKSIISGLISYLNSYEKWGVPGVLGGNVWSCVRSSGSNAWYVFMGNGNLFSYGTYGTYSVVPASAF